jgi:hypothetical protein
LPLLLPEIDRARDEFHELLANREYGLGPYEYDDALESLVRICRRNGYIFETALMPLYMRLTGGHAGLLRASLIAISERSDIFSRDIRNITETTLSLLTVSAVEAECNKIWISLAEDEKLYLADFVHRDRKPMSNWQRILCQKGILVIREDTETLAFTSTLMEAYAGRQTNVWKQRVRMDEVSRQVWVLDRRRPPMSTKEHYMFRVLYRHMGEFVPREKLIRAAWPELRMLSEQQFEEIEMRYTNEFDVIFQSMCIKVEPNPSDPVFVEIMSDSRAFRLNG